MPESALELKTTPGNYRCTWLLSKPADEECWYSEGDIDLRASRQPYGGVYGRAPINFTRTPGGGISYGAPQYFRYPVVHGQLLNGRNVALVDPVLRVMDADRSSGMFPGPNAHFDAWAALVGRGIPRTSDILVDSGVVQISHLDTFAAKGPIEETRYSRNPFEDEDPRFEVKFQQASYQVWSDDAAEVAVEYQISAAVHGGYHFGVTFSPTIRIELSEPIPFKEFFTSWVLPLHGLVSASTGRNEDITYWSCSPLLEGGDNEPPARRQFAIFNRWITQQPYASDNSLRDKHLSAIRLAEGDSLLHLLRRWQTLEAEQNPILNTYDIHSLGPDQAPRARFLLLLQALEAYAAMRTDWVGGGRAMWKDGNEYSMIAEDISAAAISDFSNSGSVKLRTVSITHLRQCSPRYP